MGMLARQMHDNFRATALQPSSLGHRLMNLQGTILTGRLTKDADPAQNLRNFVNPKTGGVFQFARQTDRELLAGMKGLYIPQTPDSFQVRGLSEQVVGLRPGHKFAVAVEAYKTPSLLGGYYLLEVDTTGNTIVSVKTVPNAY